MQFTDYILIRADHTSNKKGGGVCIVNSLNLNECIVCEVSIQINKVYIGVIYKSPNQDIIEFANFLSNS